jgi:hypothetical protein
MFLNTWLRRLYERAPTARRGSLLWATLGLPLLFFAISLVYALADVSYMATARDLGLEALDGWKTLVFNSGMSGLWLVALVLNGLAVMRTGASNPASLPR